MTKTANIHGTSGGSVTEGLPGRRYEIVSSRGHISSLKFDKATDAVAYAKECWPDQEQDPERTGKGWDVQVCGAAS